jgi:hypothetical protein
VDMMFHVFCSLGYPVALDKAAQGMGLPGKPPGMSGFKAPKLWAQGRAFTAPRRALVRFERESCFLSRPPRS